MKAYLTRLTHSERSESSDRDLALYLTFIAGAANAGGFMAVGQYTSHMSGIVSSMADTLVLGHGTLFLTGLFAVFCFILGAAASAILINWGRRKELRSVYALPLAAEACLLVVFGFSGLILSGNLPIIGLLCFIMGLQNAVITKISGARIRTTHITGLVTDAGIEFGKLLYWNRTSPPGRSPVDADREKLKLLCTMIALFFTGGVSGAVVFTQFGTAAALFLAVPLAALTLFPLLEDFSARK
ncbi:YoaK family protein [Allorhizobium undicola]|uniref:YoaK family protein n=1 Tax=Allorhizobium undicola TaxID=78527 RepID=UPI003D340444